MTDEEYVAWVERRCHRAFLPKFAGNRFFNRDLFNFILDEAGADIGLLNDEMRLFNRESAALGHSTKMRVDNAHRSIRIKIYTPTVCRKLAITDSGIDAREMDPSE